MVVMLTQDQGLHTLSFAQGILTNKKMSNVINLSRGHPCPTEKVEHEALLT